MVTRRARYPLNAHSININALYCKQIDFLNAMQKLWKNQCINDYVTRLHSTIRSLMHTHIWKLKSCINS